MLKNFRYEQIADDLRQQIQRGNFPPPRRLPSERQLMETYSVQRVTIRQALALLERQGWVEVRPKQGTFVTPANESGIASGVILVVNAWNHHSTALENIVQGLSESLANSPFTVLRFNSCPRPGEVEYNLPTADFIAANNVVGLLLWPQSPTDATALAKLRDTVPLLLADRRVLGLEADCIRFDDVAGGQMAAQHLIEQGHERIGFLADEAFAETVQQRWRGYTYALKAAGIEADAAILELFHGISDPPFADRMRLFLAGAGRPLTAVVCSNDTTALNLLRFLRSEGLRVPEDIAVTGYGNLLPEYLDTLELTTIAQPFQELGRLAGQMLIDRLRPQGTVKGSGSRQIELPVRLIVRNSTRKRILK